MGRRVTCAPDMLLHMKPIYVFSRNGCRELVTEKVLLVLCGSSFRYFSGLSRIEARVKVPSSFSLHSLLIFAGKFFKKLTTVQCTALHNNPYFATTQSETLPCSRQHHHLYLQSTFRPLSHEISSNLCLRWQLHNQTQNSPNRNGLTTTTLALQHCIAHNNTYKSLPILIFPRNYNSSPHTNAQYSTQ